MKNYVYEYIYIYIYIYIKTKRTYKVGNLMGRLETGKGGRLFAIYLLILFF